MNYYNGKKIKNILSLWTFVLEASLYSEKKLSLILKHVKMDKKEK